MKALRFDNAVAVRRDKAVEIGFFRGVDAPVMIAKFECRPDVALDFAREIVRAVLWRQGTEP